MHKIFIDGREGTTGLQIQERLASRPDVQLIQLPSERRKDLDARRAAINEADVLITCLPDQAAKESIALVQSERTRVIDPSTAHRTAPDWVYGFPELNRGQRERVRQSARVCVPGCHATGFVAALAPLIAMGIVPRDYPIAATSITGYSGGGRKMIEDYEASKKLSPDPLACPRPYALGLTHKHLPEMKAIANLLYAPVFEPIVANYYQGMIVSVPLATRLLKGGTTPETVHAALSEHYAGETFVRVMPRGAENADGSSLNPQACNGTNRLELFVCGHAEQILLLSRLDNLGKGASGAAVQVLNLMLGVDEHSGLEHRMA